MLKTIIKKITNSALGVTLMKYGEIKAVHDSDLETFLKSIGEYEKVLNGNAKCFFCNGEISFKNIVSIFPLNDEVNYCCDKNQCYASLIERGKNDA